MLSDLSSAPGLASFGADEVSKVYWRQTLDHYREHFVSTIDHYVRNYSVRTVADIGTGYGWLAIALANSSYRIIAVDNDLRRISQARRLAQLLGVADQIEWVVASVADLPFTDRSIDVTFCVEVLEHVADPPARGVKELARITRHLAVVTTPNRFFPMLAHDTKLPFCHWLPLIWRNRYARLFGRHDMQNNNHFLRPNDLTDGFSEFVRVSRFLQFPNYETYRHTVRRPMVRSVASLVLCQGKEAFYLMCAMCGGGRSFYLLPNLASAFRRAN